MVRYLVLVWLCLAATIAYVQRNSLGVAESTIRGELGISEQAMGWIGSAFFASYGAAPVADGMVVAPARLAAGAPAFRRLVVERLGLPGAGARHSGTLERAADDGSGAGRHLPAAANTITKWFPVTRRSVASGALAAFMSVGGAAGVAMTGYLINGVGWRTTFALYALPGIAWAIGFGLWFRDSPSEHPAVEESELAAIRGRSVPLAIGDTVTTMSREPVPWGVILRSAALWWIGCQQFFRAAGQVFFATWFPTYLQQTRGVSVPHSGLLTSLPVLAVVLGSLAGGLLSDWLLSRTSSRRVARQALAVVSLLACTVLVVLAFFIRDTTLAVLAISGGQFFASCAGPCAYAISMDLSGRHVTTVFSFMNMCGNLGAFAFPIVVPALVAWTGAWDAVLFTFAGIHLAAAVCWLCFDGNREILPAAMGVVRP